MTGAQAVTAGGCPTCGHVPPPAIINQQGVADVTGRSLATVRKWRRTWLPGRPAAGRVGPQPLELDTGTIGYVAAEVLAWRAGEVDRARARAAASGVL